MNGNRKQDGDESAAIGTPEHYRWLRGIVAAIFVLNAFDAVFTIFWIVTRGATEANPLMDHLMAIHPVVFMAGKLALVGLGTYLLWRLRHVKAAVIAIFMVFLAYYALLLYHLDAIESVLVYRAWG